MKDFWINRENRLFITPPGGVPEYQCFVTISRVVFGNDKDYVLINGILPKAISLNNFENGSLMEILNKNDGIPKEYYPNDVILRLCNCTLIKKWIDRPIISHPRDTEVLSLHLYLNCKVELVNEIS